MTKEEILNRKEKFRLITRSDMDGLVCAVLLKHLNIIDDIKFVHPKDMQDDILDITDKDITTNLPFVKGCAMSFDHHLSESIRNKENTKHVINPEAPSAARVVFDYFGGYDNFPKDWEDMMTAVDKADSAQFSKEDILNPQGWDLLSFLMDARTGLGRFRDFRISNYQLMMELIDYCKNHTIEDILKLPDVIERINLYNKYSENFKQQLLDCSSVYDNVIVLDLRDEEIIYPGNRFMIYALYPEQTISIHVIWGLKQKNTVFAVGKSIINRTSNFNIGELLLTYNGGGHENAGTCQVQNETANIELHNIINIITKNNLK